MKYDTRGRIFRCLVGLYCKELFTFFFHVLNGIISNRMGDLNINRRDVLFGKKLFCDKYKYEVWTILFFHQTFRHNEETLYRIISHHPTFNSFSDQNVFSLIYTFFQRRLLNLLYDDHLWLLIQDGIHIVLTRFMRPDLPRSNHITYFARPIQDCTKDPLLEGPSL